MAQHFGASVSLTSDNSFTSFGFRPTYVRIDASTLNSAFLHFQTSMGSTASSFGGYQLTSGAPPIVISNAEISGMSSGFHALTTAGGTTVIRVLAIRI